jgi:hypothetical protein
VSNAFGTATSTAAVLTVIQNSPPTSKITAPVAGSLYNAGDTIRYSGSGTDVEDGPLPASALTWRVDFHHDTHVHPFLPSTTGISEGTFTVPNTGETSTNVWYRIYLTVKDSTGLTQTSFVDIKPRVSTLRFQTTPGGLVITVDGQPHATAYTVSSVVGMLRTIGADAQTKNGRSFVFGAWSDGGPAVHTIVTPVNTTTYTADFVVSR